MKNAYARKLQLQKQIATQETYMLAAHRTTDFLQAVFTLALHEEGFGKERIKRINAYVDEIVAEYTEMQNDDIEYADAKLREAVQKIIGEEAE